MHLTRLELAHPKALPPQGSVYTNFTTGAYVYYNIFFRYGRKILKLFPSYKGAIYGILFPHNLGLNTPYVLWGAILKGLFDRPINNIIKAVFTRN